MQPLTHVRSAWGGINQSGSLSEEKTNFNLLKEANLELFPQPPSDFKTSSADEKHIKMAKGKANSPK